jgi:dihydrofolate reductase
MSRLRVANFSLSLDGYGAGPGQSLEHPLGVNGMELHGWLFKTPFFHRMQGKEGGLPGVDADFADRGFENVGAWILGRNMFGPVRGPWPDDAWRGWWGEEPPYHAPVFVLTHHERSPIPMKGDTTFHFVTGGIQEALRRVREAAGGKEVRLGGGVSTVRQYVREKLVDELHLAVAPVLLGRGEALFEGLDWRALGYRCTKTVAGENATHVIIGR